MVKGWNPGPTITQFCVEPGYIKQRSGGELKVKISKIAALADDLGGGRGGCNADRSVRRARQVGGHDGGDLPCGAHAADLGELRGGERAGPSLHRPVRVGLVVHRLVGGERNRHVPRDAGRAWSEVTPRELPPGSLVSQIDPSPHDPGTAYLAVNRYKLDDYRPQAFVTHDYGKSWRRIAEGLPPICQLPTEARGPRTRYFGAFP